MQPNELNIYSQGIDLKRRVLFMHGTAKSDPDGEEPGIEYMMTAQVIKGLHTLMWMDKDAPVDIHMITCGGCWNMGMAIFNTIESMPYPVTIYAYAHARSMSSIILQAADCRVMMPDAYFLAHFGTYGFDGNSKAMLSNAEYEKVCNDRMLNIYASAASGAKKHKGKSVAVIKKEIREKLDEKEDLIFTASEAVEYGFADEVFGGWE